METAKEVSALYINLLEKIFNGLYDGKLTTKFEELVNEVCEKIKLTFKNKIEYSEICLLLDKIFQTYLDSKKS